MKHVCNAQISTNAHLLVSQVPVIVMSVITMPINRFVNCVIDPVSRVLIPTKEVVLLVRIVTNVSPLEHIALAKQHFTMMALTNVKYAMCYVKNVKEA
jgi:hypothetical protein